MTAIYVTAKQLAKEVGGITEATVRTMRGRGMPYFKPGKAYLYNREKALAWIAAQEESKCQDQTQGRASSQYPAAKASTSSGSNTGENGAKALALRTAERLKRSSCSSSRSAKSAVVPLDRRARTNTR